MYDVLLFQNQQYLMFLILKFMHLQFILKQENNLD